VGVSDRDFAIVFSKVVALYFQGKYREAAALAISEKALGPSHPDVAQSLNDLAVAYHEQGKYSEETELHPRALAIRDKAFGPSNSVVAGSFNNLAPAS
jgi:hypothetical protein